MNDRQILTRRFEKIEPTARQQFRIDQIRVKFQFFVAQLDETVPDSREKTRAFNALEDAMTLIEKAITRNT